MTRFAMLFPGQGSQSVGMLAALEQGNPVVSETFAQAGDVLGRDLAGLVSDGPADELNQTENTQPALLAAGVAVWRLWQQRGGATPQIMAGHSLGEYTALVCAGALDFADGIRLTALRGQAMQAAVPAGEGAMAAVIGLDDDAVQTVCKQAAQDGIVAPANFNARGQVVIAGSTAAVERAMAQAKQAGAKLVKQLAVSVPSHCSLMQPAAEQLQAALTDINLCRPGIPVVHNLDAGTGADVEAIRTALVGQLDHPVQWVATIESIARDGVGLMLECGPGKVLTGLNKRIDKSIKTIALQTPDGLDSALEAAD